MYVLRTFRLSIFLNIPLREAADSSFVQNIRKGGEKKKDVFGTVIDRNGDFTDSSEWTSLSTR
jgi:hypothetical protein